MLKAVLFDAGSTLFRVRGSVGQAYATVAARHGVIVEPGAIEPRFRAAFRQMPALAFPDAAPDELPQREYAWWRQLVATVFTGVRFADFDVFFRALFDYFAEAAAWEVFEDVRPTLAALQRRGLRLGLVSNFDGRLVPICKGLGIAGDFAAVVMSARAGAAKPDPRIFQMALTRLGVDAGEAIHVGDSEREDVEGAQAAGVRAVLLQRQAAPGGASLGAHSPVVYDLRALLTFL